MGRARPGRGCAPLKPGDGVVFDAADWRSPEEREEGGRLFEVRPAPAGRLELAFGNGLIDFSRVRAGDWVWRTSDPELDRAVRGTTRAAAPVVRQAMHARVTASEGQPLVVEMALALRPEVAVTVRARLDLDTAQRRPLDAAQARDHLGRLGGTPYELADLELIVEGRPFAPSSLLNGLRREAVAALSELQARPPRRVVEDPASALSGLQATLQGRPPAVAVEAPSHGLFGDESTPQSCPPNSAVEVPASAPSGAATTAQGRPTAIAIEETSWGHSGLQSTPQSCPPSVAVEVPVARSSGLQATLQGRPTAAVVEDVGSPAAGVPLAPAGAQRVDPSREEALRGPRTQAASVPAAALHLMVRSADQLEAALDLRPASVTLDYLDLYGLEPAVDRGRSAGVEMRVASPRIQKPGEDRITQFLLRLGCPILVRSTGLLEALRAQAHPPLHGDFSLNAANALTARVFFGLGLERLTPTHDLNAAQVAALARAVGPDRFEVLAFQHLPVFHTEHCVFCRFLSEGTSYKDCGRPCEKHRVALRDEHGREHPVLADVGCRNTVFGAEAQEASAHLRSWQDAGLRHFRLEFVHEGPDELRAVTRAFDQALAGRMPMKDLTRQLRKLVRQGTTEGSLFIPVDALR